MNLNNAIITAILIAICVMPIMYIIWRRKKSEKLLLISLSNIAKLNNCQISLYEHCGNVLIGIDEIKKFVFYYKKTSNKTIEEAIDLSKYQNCKVIKTNRSQSGNNVEVEKLELSFVPIAKDNTNIIIEIYNYDDSFQLYGELQFIEKWAKKINSLLK